MITSFNSEDESNIWNGKFVKKLPTTIQKKARMKLRMINNANALEDLKNPPGNHLEILIGNRKGQYSIRINNQWRICFHWNDGNASEVEIVDYH